MKLNQKYQTQNLFSVSLQLSGKATNLVQAVIKQTYEKAEECLNTNYYGCKKVTEALLPLLKLSTLGARIINVSSLRGELKVRTIFNCFLSFRYPHHSSFTCACWFQQNQKLLIQNYHITHLLACRGFQVRRYETNLAIWNL